MSLINNTATLTFCRIVFSLMNRSKVLGKDRLPKSHDGLLLACVHLSHYDPFAISVLVRKKVAWMARIESFQTPVSDFLTTHCGAFRIDRFGKALPGIRDGLRRLERGELVGIYPEGEVLSGADSVLNGAPMKRGVGLLARRSGAPVVPCIVLNSEHFSKVVSWLPFKTGRLWLAYGQPLYADPSLPHGRASRAELTERLEVAFRELHQEMVEKFSVPAECCPVKSFSGGGVGPFKAELSTSTAADS